VLHPQRWSLGSVDRLGQPSGSGSRDVAGALR